MKGVWQMGGQFYVFVAKGEAMFRAVLPEGAEQYWKTQFAAQFPQSAGMELVLVDENSWQYPMVGYVAEYKDAGQFEPFYEAIGKYLQQVAGLPAEQAGAAVQQMRQNCIVQLSAADNTLAFGVPVGLPQACTGPMGATDPLCPAPGQVGAARGNVQTDARRKKEKMPLPPAQMMAAIKIKPTALLYIISVLMVAVGLTLTILCGIGLSAGVGVRVSRIYLISGLTLGILLVLSGVFRHVVVATQRHKYKQGIDYSVVPPEYVSTRTKTTAVVLSALSLTGFSGWHRFYLGKIVSGIISFMTAGGCYIWAAIDLCTLLDNQFLDKKNRIPLPKDKR